MIRPADFPARAQYTVHKHHLQIPLFPGNAWRAKYIPWRNCIVALKDVDESRSLKRLYRCSEIQRCPSSNKVTLMVVCNDDQGLSLLFVVRRGAPAFSRGWRTTLRLWSALYKNKSGCHAKFMPCSDTSGDEFTSFFLTRCLVY